MGTEKIFQGLSDEAYIGVCTPAPTVCHHHLDVCGQCLDLKYDALYLKSRIFAKDASLFEKFIGHGESSRLSTDFVPPLGLGLAQSAGEHKLRCSDEEIVRKWM